jgi:RNA polymerase sigma factor (sigma-70 family)
MSRDSERLQAAIDGDPAAVESLLLESYDAVLRHIEFAFPAHLAARTSPQDIIQETFVRAYRSLGSFRPRDHGSFRGWLRTIADNVLRDEMRSTSRRPRATPTVAPADSSTSGFANILDLIEADEPEPYVQAGREELLRAAEVAYAGLEPRYQEAILLCGLQGAPYDVLATSLGVSVDAARGVYFRARQKLKEGIVRLSL